MVVRFDPRKAGFSEYHAFRPGMSLSEMILAARKRRPLPEAAGTRA
jgi:hypothetical protein